jgi:hypothetical protein
MARSSEKLIATAQTNAQRGLHQRIREGEGARQQRGRVHLDGEIICDHGDHGIDCACEQGLRKNHEADDF